MICVAGGITGVGQLSAYYALKDVLYHLQNWRGMIYIHIVNQYMGTKCVKYIGSCQSIIVLVAAELTGISLIYIQ